MNTIDRDHFLQIFPAFRSAPSLAEDIIALGRHNRIPADVIVKLEGDECQDFVLMLSGEKRIYKTSPSSREITLYEIGPGDICVLNASCILSNTRLPANAATTCETDVLLLSAREFLDLIAEHEEMSAFVHAHINTGITAIMTLISEIVFGKMDERLINYLIEKSGNDHLDKTHHQIAQDLGTSREVVSRLLKELERQGLIALARHHIELTGLQGQGLVSAEPDTQVSPHT